MLFAKSLKNIILQEDIRVSYDDREERMAKKIRESNVMKNPITIIVGDNERDNNLVSYSVLGSEEKHTISIDEFIKFIKKEIKRR